MCSAKTRQHARGCSLVGLGAAGIADSAAAAALQSSAPTRAAAVIGPEQHACSERNRLAVLWRKRAADQNGASYSGRRPPETLAAAAQPSSLESAKGSKQPSIDVVAAIASPTSTAGCTRGSSVYLACVAWRTTLSFACSNTNVAGAML